MLSQVMGSTYYTRHGREKLLTEFWGELQRVHLVIQEKFTPLPKLGLAHGAIWAAVGFLPSA